MYRLKHCRECYMKNMAHKRVIKRQMYSRNQEKKRNVITLQKATENYRVYYTRTTQNYRPHYAKLRYTDNTTDKLSAHSTDTNQVSCTQIQHSDVAMHNLHMKLT